jgi:hypothetical protein
LEGIRSHLASYSASDRERFHILLGDGTWARQSQKRCVSVYQINCEVPVESIEVGLSGEILRPLICRGILVDLVEGLEVHVEDIPSLGDLEVGSKIVIQGYTYGVDLDAHISFAQDSEAEGEHKSKFEESFH